MQVPINNLDSLVSDIDRVPVISVDDRVFIEPNSIVLEKINFTMREH